MTSPPSQGTLVASAQCQQAAGPSQCMSYIPVEDGARRVEPGPLSGPQLGEETGVSMGWPGVPCPQTGLSDCPCPSTSVLSLIAPQRVLMGSWVGRA